METIGIAALGFVLVGFALWALLSPQTMMGRIEDFWRGGDRVVWVAGLRIAVGGYLLAVAQATPWPQAAMVLGALFIAAGLGVAALGQERIDRILEWWLERPTAVIQSISVLWIGFAALLFYLGLVPA